MIQMEMTESPIIFQQFQGLKNNIPWISLGNFPTPVERLTNIEKDLELNSLWIKRDDLSGELYGGNKVRMLEFSLAEALQQRAELIFTYSAMGSYWPLACVIYAKLHGLPTNVFYFPYPLDSIKKINLDLTQKLANQVLSAKSLLTFLFLLYLNLYKVRKRSKVYLMPPGGASPVTTLGFVNAILELKEQCARGEMPIPDYLFCPLGSGGTAAGLSIGLNIVGWKTRVIAVRVVDLILANKFTLNRLIRKTVKNMQDCGANLSSATNWGRNIRIEHNYLGRGYSKPTPLGENSIKILKTRENQVLDSTYTGKTFAAILDLSKKNIYKNKNVLFWQTLNSRNLDIAIQ